MCAEGGRASRAHSFATSQCVQVSDDVIERLVAMKAALQGVAPDNDDDDEDDDDDDDDDDL